MIAAVILFGILSFLGSAAIARKQAAMDRSALALTIVLIAWGSLALGMFVSSDPGPTLSLSMRK